MSIADNLRQVKSTLPPEVTLVAVSKFHPQEALRELYDAGHKIFGESRMQEMDMKHQLLPEDIEWHFIGHLQRNKVKDVVPYAHVIHSVDSERLLKEIVKESDKQEKEICCLLQIHIAEEDTKYGFSMDKCRELLEKGDWKTFKYAYIGGVMGMATYTEDKEQVRTEFRKLRNFFDELKNKYFAEDNRFKEISMGMSGDYQIAIEEGSTMVRIGTTIFGEREY